MSGMSRRGGLARMSRLGVPTMASMLASMLRPAAADPRSIENRGLELCARLHVLLVRENPIRNVRHPRIVAVVIVATMCVAVLVAVAAVAASARDLDDVFVVGVLDFIVLMVELGTEAVPLLTVSTLASDRHENFGVGLEDGVCLADPVEVLEGQGLELAVREREDVLLTVVDLLMGDHRHLAEHVAVWQLVDHSVVVVEVESVALGE
mmetsp:Transcript_35938/g.83341  ORF Transcript_35938/g.83341 Transcript_35938/m.83341 type:complete len:208 (-) Transcript_35938:2439-3062(-)